MCRGSGPAPGRTTFSTSISMRPGLSPCSPSAGSAGRLGARPTPTWSRRLAGPKPAMTYARVVAGRTPVIPKVRRAATARSAGRWVRTVVAAPTSQPIRRSAAVRAMTRRRRGPATIRPRRAMLRRLRLRRARLRPAKLRRARLRRARLRLARLRLARLRLARLRLGPGGLRVGPGEAMSTRLRVGPGAVRPTARGRRGPPSAGSAGMTTLVKTLGTRRRRTTPCGPRRQTTIPPSPWMPRPGASGASTRPQFGTPRRGASRGTVRPRPARRQPGVGQPPPARRQPGVGQPPPARPRRGTSRAANRPRPGRPRCGPNPAATRLHPAGRPPGVAQPRPARPRRGASRATTVGSRTTARAGSGGTTILAKIWPRAARPTLPIPRRRPPPTRLVRTGRAPPIRHPTTKPRPRPASWPAQRPRVPLPPQPGRVTPRGRRHAETTATTRTCSPI
ncbi:pentapeptide repeat-containing protein [Asanoa sp. NPDC049573]|uniref:pentapeptide repeat-containing protein n=1 Tax=Asanoa sp. NPDC049573 TaxID=3155396 RepID=UPI003413A0C8